MTSLPIVDETDLEPVELGQQTEPDGLDHDVRDNGWNEASLISISTVFCRFYIK